MNGAAVSLHEVSAAVSLHEVRHQRAGREVLHIATLDVAPGERLALLGPNGAGKTTLLRLVAALEPPSSGAVLIDGAIAHAGGAALRRRIAYAPQRPVLLSTTVANNIELPLRYRRQPRSTRRTAVAEALERLAINHLAARRASALSGGEAQRVSLARALVTEPALLLLDEPAASLDPSARADFLADVRSVLTDRPVTAIVATHRVEEACALADRIAVLKDGAVHQIDTPAELLTHPTDSTVARLVGFENVLEAHVTDDGKVHIAGQPTGLATHPQTRPLTIATWAAGIRVHPISTPGVRARVRSSTPGPGRWELQLDAGQPIHAHLPLTANHPNTGDTVAVTLDPAQTVALGIAKRSTALLRPSVSAELPAPARRR